MMTVPLNTALEYQTAAPPRRASCANDGAATRLGCPEFRRMLAMERRSFLKAGVLGMAGLSLGELLKFEALAAAGGKSPSRQSSVIILWMRGGPSQHETWDPKPDAPIEYRGEFGAIPTRVPGIQLCELLPMSARIMDKWSIIRSLHHEDAGHSTDASALRSADSVESRLFSLALHDSHPVNWATVRSSSWYD